MSKIQMIKTNTFRILKFDHLNLFQISDFGFRISDFEFVFVFWLTIDEGRKVLAYF
jgi:hypothetical protein